MKKIIESSDLHILADEIINKCDFLDLLDDDEGADIGFFTPDIRQAALDLKAIADLSKPAQETL